MCLSAETTAEQWTSVPTWSPSPTAAVHTLWLSTGGETLPAWSVDACSSTEPYSSCACQPEQQMKKESQAQIERIRVESPRSLTNVPELSNNLLMIHIKTHNYSLTLIHELEQITNTFTILEKLRRSHPLGNMNTNRNSMANHASSMSLGQSRLKYLNKYKDRLAWNSKWKHSWCQQDEAFWLWRSPDFSSNTTSRLAVSVLTETKYGIAVKFGSDIHAPLRMNCIGFVDRLTFHHLSAIIRATFFFIKYFCLC